MTSDLLTVAADDTVLMAWELMRREPCHHLPVVTDEGRLIGVLTADSIAMHWREGGPDSNRRPVSELLGRWRTTLTAEDTVATAAIVMLREHVDAVAVTDANDLLVGLVTSRDLLGALAGRRHEGRSAHVSTPSLYRIEPVMPAHGRTPSSRESSRLPPD